MFFKIILSLGSYRPPICAKNLGLLWHQTVKYKHKDLQYYKSVPSRDEGVKETLEHDLFKWGDNHSKDLHASITENKLLDNSIEDENLEDIDHPEKSETEWATNILGKFVPNEDTLERIYGDSQMSFSEIPICFIKASQNNTIIDVRDPMPASPFETSKEMFNTYQQLCYSSCGVEGFKNAKKGTNIAGQAVGLSVATKCIQKGIKMVRVVVRGLGPGRMASVKGLHMGGMQIISITDNTRIPHGQRPRKQRKV